MERENGQVQEGEIDSLSLPNQQPEKLHSVQEAMQQMTADPESFARLASRAFSQAGPEMIEHAKKLAAGPEGQAMVREMQSKGMTPAQAKNLKKQMKKVQAELAPPRPSCQAVLIRATRVAKSIELPIESPEKAAASLLRGESPALLNCSRLSAGPLAGKPVKVFCDPAISARNKRISRLAGFPLGGDVIVFCQGSALSLADFEALEKILLKS